jgi:hypothetical protein
VPTQSSQNQADKRGTSTKKVGKVKKNLPAKARHLQKEYSFGKRISTFTCRNAKN